MSESNPWACALVVILAYTISGLVQTAWLKTALSMRFALPLDGGHTVLGRRIFGANKTWRGVVVLVPATALAFVVVASGLEQLVGGALSRRVWPLPLRQWACLGALSAVGYVLAELPNSFVKRQMGIAPGQAARTPWARAFCFLMDQVDSTFGVLLGIAVVVPTTWQFCALVVWLGAVWHWCFACLLYLLGVKQRPA